MADLAADSNVHVIGVSYQADGYLSLFPALREKLRMRRRRRRTSLGGEDKAGAEEEEEEEEEGDMVAVAEWIIPTHDQHFSWEEGKTAATKRAGATILYLVPGLALPTPPYMCCISFATKMEGGENDLHMISELHLKLDFNLKNYPSTSFCFVVLSFSDVNGVGLIFVRG